VTQWYEIKNTKKFNDLEVSGPEQVSQGQVKYQQDKEGTHGIIFVQGMCK